MTEWIGGIGDVRVVCVSTKKIYSCPEAAAYHQNMIEPPSYGYSITEKDIIMNCNNFVKTIVSGKTFQWYNQYLLDNKLDDFYLPPTVLPISKPLSLREELRKKKQSIAEYYGPVRIMYIAIKKAYLKNQSIIGHTFTIEQFLNLIGWEVTRGQLSATVKHFRSRKKIYEELFGMELGYFPSLKSSREVASIKLNKFTSIGTSDDIARDPSIKSYFSTYHDEISKAMTGDRSGSHPIMRISDHRIYGSISQASTSLQISADRIRWCCDGDIPYVSKWANNMEFRYVKFID